MNRSFEFGPSTRTIDRAMFAMLMLISVPNYENEQRAPVPPIKKQQRGKKQKPVATVPLACVEPTRIEDLVAVLPRSNPLISGSVQGILKLQATRLFDAYWSTPDPQAPVCRSYSQWDIARRFADLAPASGVPAWFVDIVEIDRKKPVKALEILFEHVDQLLKKQCFALIDQWIGSLKPTDLSSNLIVGILSITRPASDRLYVRRRFYAECRPAVEQRGRDPLELLSGFEGRRADDGAST